MFIEPIVTVRAAAPRRPLAESDAVDIWIARWLRVRRKDLCQRYQCDPRRLYEIWEERRFPGTRDTAMQLFHARYPTLTDRIDYGRHRRIPREMHADQLPLFEVPATTPPHSLPPKNKNRT